MSNTREVMILKLEGGVTLSGGHESHKRVWMKYLT